MNFDDMKDAINDAESTLRRADNLTDSIARFLIGRLRKVVSYNTLKHLKHELTEYDAHTHRWKS